MDHLLLLVWQAFLIAVFFSFLWREDRPSRVRMFLKTFLILVLGAFLVGWLMYPFP